MANPPQEPQRNLSGGDLILAGFLVSIVSSAILMLSNSFVEDHWIHFITDQSIFAPLCSLLTATITFVISVVRYKVSLKKFKMEYKDKVNLLDELINQAPDEDTKSKLKAKKSAYLLALSERAISSEDMSILKN
ncbi:hypothetical protein KIV40_20275 [Vibrio sp. D173a]|uniref:hypothetical protein n=1 Tax=Vibrio sp. D173a TaxID=2836349 RepID=UPI002555ACA1|nr:hypothetical protein [Vibrio sp. D173a]MDK9757667.1 hypothetical protein [Vibrio sp. D173a]